MWCYGQGKFRVRVRIRVRVGFVNTFGVIGLHRNVWIQNEGNDSRLKSCLP